MSEMIERVARALTDVRDKVRVMRWDDIPGEQEIGRMLARAAIAAMGEPIPQTMLDAGSQCLPFLNRDWTPGQIVAATCWRAMVDAALVERTGDK